MLFGLRTFAFSLALGIAAVSTQTAQAQSSDFPSKTVRIVIPFSAGGAPDVLLRLVAPHLSEKWKQPVVIENRPGANTNIGTVLVTKADADGHTLLFSSDGTFIFNPLIYPSLPYAVSELAPISFVAAAPGMLAAATHMPVKSVAELVALAKSKPGAINYGSTGPASIQRLMMEYFAMQAGFTMNHVPFKGANETVMAMLGNQMDVAFSAASNILPHIPTGKLRALAITSTKRSPQAPEVPTMQESGITDYEAYSMFALFAPARTSPDIIKKIEADVIEVTMRPEIKAAIVARGFEYFGMPAAEFQKLIERDTVKWSKVIAASNLKEKINQEK
jgi:tripartite-type tricarboxylate transporter receptor subunit TctC